MQSSESFEESSSDSKGPKSHKVLSSRHSTILDKHHTNVDKKEKDKKDKDKKDKDRDKEREKEEKKEAKRRSILEKTVSTQQFGLHKHEKTKKRLSLGKPSPSPTLQRVSETEASTNNTKSNDASSSTNDKSTLFYERIKKLRENGHKRVRSEGVDMKYKTLMDKKKKQTGGQSAPATPEATKEKNKLSPRKLFKRTTSSREMDRRTTSDINPYATLSRHTPVQTIVIDPETGTKKTHRKSRSFASLQDVFQEIERQERANQESEGMSESTSKKGLLASKGSVASPDSIGTPNIEHVNMKSSSSVHLATTRVSETDQVLLGSVRSPSEPANITRKRRSLSAAEDSDVTSSPSIRKSLLNTSCPQC